MMKRQFKNLLMFFVFCVITLWMHCNGTKPQVFASNKSYDMCEDLRDAVIENDVAKVQILLQQHGKSIVNSFRDFSENTLLTLAVSYGCLEIVDILLEEKDIDVNAEEYQGYTALMLAVMKGDRNIVRRLLQYDCIDVNAESGEKAVAELVKKYGKDKYIYFPEQASFKLGDTALILAVRSGRKDIVEMLLQKDGINVNAQDYEGYTALMWAVKKEYRDIVERLLQVKDICVDIMNRERKTAFDMAEHDVLNKIFFKAKKATVDIKYDWLDWSLKSELYIMNLLETKDVNVNIKDCKGNMLLDVMLGNREMPVKIIQKCVAVGAKSSYPIVNAIINNDEKAIYYCISQTSFKEEVQRIEKSFNIIDVAVIMGFERSYNILMINGYREVSVDTFCYAIQSNSGLAEIVLESLCESDFTFRDVLYKLRKKAFIINEKGIDCYDFDNYIMFKKIMEFIFYKNIECEDVMEEIAESMLFFPVYIGDAEEVRALCNLNFVNINGRDSLGYTVLMRAVEKGNTEIIKILLGKEGIDVNAKNNEGHTALILAAMIGDTEVIKILLGVKGIALNAKDNAGHTALMWAGVKADTDVIKILLGKEGIDVNAKDSEGYTALMWAIKDRYKEVYMEPVYVMMDWPTRIVEKLLEVGDIDVNARDKDGKTALMWAVESRKMEDVKKLLEAGGDVNVGDNKGKTVLMLELERILENWRFWNRDDEYDKFLKVLLEVGGINVNAKDNEGNTALMLVVKKEPIIEKAIREKQISVVKMLLRAERIDVNARDKDGKTALMWAICKEDIQIIQTLASEGNIDIYLEDDSGMTALQLALDKRQKYFGKELMRIMGFYLNRMGVMVRVS